MEPFLGYLLSNGLISNKQVSLLGLRETGNDLKLYHLWLFDSGEEFFSSYQLTLSMFLHL